MEKKREKKWNKYWDSIRSKIYIKSYDDFIYSIIDSQNPETKLRFHFAVVLSFNVEHMLKIYSLRERIREDVEFNFYNAKKAEIDLRNANTKGPGAVAKLLLPNLLPKNVDKLILYIFINLNYLKNKPFAI